MNSKNWYDFFVAVTDSGPASRTGVLKVTRITLDVVSPIAHFQV